jgi:hypothetical protein
MKRLYRAKTPIIINRNPQYQDCIIDLDQIESFVSVEDHKGDSVTQVRLKSSDCLVVDTNFDKFSSMMHQLPDAVKA